MTHNKFGFDYILMLLTPFIIIGLAFGFLILGFEYESRKYLDMEVSSSGEFVIIEIYKNGNEEIKNKIKLLNSDGMITNKEFSELKDYVTEVEEKNKLKAQKKILKELTNG